MKHIISIVSITLLLTACGQNKTQTVADVIATDNLQTIRLKRNEIVAQQQEITEKLKQLDAKIAVLDTQKKVPLITTFKVKQKIFTHFLE